MVLKTFRKKKLLQDQETTEEKIDLEDKETEIKEEMIMKEEKEDKEIKVEEIERIEVIEKIEDQEDSKVIEKEDPEEKMAKIEDPEENKETEKEDPEEKMMKIEDLDVKKVIEKEDQEMTISLKFNGLKLVPLSLERTDLTYLLRYKYYNLGFISRTSEEQNESSLGR